MNIEMYLVMLIGGVIGAYLSLLITDRRNAKAWRQSENQERQ